MALKPMTTPHFAAYASRLVYDDGETRPPEDWQLRLVDDIFAGYRRNLWIIPEASGKTTLISLIALYGADYTETPWIPVAASAAKQATIVYQQAAGFVRRTPTMNTRFECLDGIKLIRSIRNPGPGIQVFAHDPATGDGVIPSPWALLDEMHRHPDMRLWDLWAGKLRKRDAQVIGISTAGEPEAPFELLRDEVRRRAKKRKRTGSHLRAEAPGEVLHEWMVPTDEACSDMDAVKAANPLSLTTPETLAEDFALVTNLGDWKRLKCNRPTRSVQSAVSDREWETAETHEEIPARAHIDLGVDVAWKWDTFAIVPLHIPRTIKVEQPNGTVKDLPLRLLGTPHILTPPRDGSSLHPDDVKNAFLEFHSAYVIGDVVMDMGRGEDIAAWLEDELGVRVIDRTQSNALAVEDFNSFMDGIRNGTLKHTGDLGLKLHVLHAIARRLPGGDYRFDRPSAQRGQANQQDRRVIDALTAASFVVQHSTRSAPKKSVYEDRYANA